ncbi:MAG: von Willebrand factor type A domain-containing protein [Ignavibacteria bacterium]|jgi:Ca-activated chloride channel family protein
MKKYIISVLFLSTLLFAKEKGSIGGRVIDFDTRQPLIGVNVLITGTNFGSATDANGYYKIKNLPPGRYEVKAGYVGYKTAVKKNVIVKEGFTTKLNFELIGESVEYGALEIVADESLMKKSNNMYFSVTRQDLGFPNFNTEEYDYILESGFLDVIKNPFSTFAADVDGASYSNARRFIMQDEIPHIDVVRSEEFINYFNYDYKQPEGNDPLSINIEYSECPWNEKNRLINIGLKGKELSKENQEPSNLVFLLDVSGSMQSPKKLPLLKRSFKMLVEQLLPEDKISMVVYAGNAGLVLPPTKGSEKQTIINALDKLEAGGSTAGGAGIQLAYKVAKENFIKEGNNRVILATDGDFNVGISNTSELVRFIEGKKEEGIFLTVLGFGMGNYKDDRLQELADKGNGNHAYIDNILEAKKVFVNELQSTLFTIAKDVKIQVEFNPAKIKSYRLIGYENRELQDEDFVDDKKDAGEIGAGHTVTALYEVVPADEEYIKNFESKYTETKIKDDALNSDEVLTVRIRYKEPDGNRSKEISKVLKDDLIAIDESSDNFRFSAAVAEFAMFLRDSEYKGSTNLNSISSLAKSAIGKDEFGYRSEFLTLVERVSVLKDQK